MKFIYCPECKELRPKSWYHYGDCILCGKKSMTIKIPISIFGYLMYAFSAVGIIFVSYEIADIQTGLGDLRLFIMFGAIIAALVFSYIETSRATELAVEKVGKVR
ncbi:MAG: hypothetical protein LUQ09_03995 [Methanomassiliicoccales archaeon]|nr:hypothetical protein [Methanomassiliicoccales archaeon]